MAPETIRFATLDVFTKTLYAGNPLGVVFLPTSSTLSQDQKQRIAKEFNYSETIFVHPVDPTTPNQQKIDIFVPDAEIRFAGHPTIGAASWVTYLGPQDDAAVAAAAKVDTLVTKAGPIPISLRPEGDAVSALIPHDVRIHQKRFPAAKLLLLHPSLQPHLAATLDGHGGFPVVSIVKGMAQIHVQLPSLEALAAVGPAVGGEYVSDADVTKGGYLDEGWGIRGLVVIYFHVRGVVDQDSGKQVIRTRMVLGVEEDPATGSAASGLAALLALDEGQKGAEYEYSFVQGVEMGRRSDIGIRVVTQSDGSGSGIKEIELSGSAVKVFEGEMRV
ncbi:hypothetical protein BGW36DRAFT_389640, partial [Talaromyces proteolyticus]